MCNANYCKICNECNTNNIGPVDCLSNKTTGNVNVLSEMIDIRNGFTIIRFHMMNIIMHITILLKNVVPLSF